MFVTRIRQMTHVHWLVLFAVVLAAWGALYAMSLPADLRAAEAIYGASFWQDLCTVTPDAAGFIRICAMWILMSGAMMAPTAFPSFATYDDLSHSAKGTRFSHLVFGYLTIWIGFSVLAAALQLALFQMNLISAFGDSISVVFSAALLALAGLYQFSPIKDACLSKCRQPLTFFMAHWDEGPLRNGVRLGVICLGCCWTLMLLGFVGGVNNLAFMGLATLIMVFEKLPQVGRYLTRPLGVVLLAAVAWLLISLL